MIEQIITTALCWYLTGIVGTCMFSYVDSRHGCSREHLAEFLAISLWGMICLGVGLYAFWFEFVEQSK